MNEYLFVAAQAYGDNVVSLRLLRELRGRVRVRILGTELTREIAGVVGFDAFPIETLSGGLLALYNVRAAGPWHAARDFARLRQALWTSTTRHTMVMFENQRRPRTHRLLQMVGGNFRYAEPRWGDSAYGDRQKMLERVLNIEIALPPAAVPPRRLQRVVIAPSARRNFRAIPHQTVAYLIDYFSALAVDITLVDARGHYDVFESRVARYLARQPLAFSAASLHGADLAVVPDSLFLHLAYYLGVPAIALVPAEIAQNFYFAPPGMLGRGLYLPFGPASIRERLFSYLDSLPRT